MTNEKAAMDEPKSQIFEGDNHKKNYTAKELKKELQSLSMEIIKDDIDVESDDDHGDFLGNISKAIEALTALKELNLKKSKKSDQFDDLNVPDEFRCPISREIMKDPVVLATGQTYDRPFIHRWLKDGQRTCPQTQQVLSHTVLTPNHLVRELIAQWCKDHGIQLPPPQDVDDGAITKADRVHLTSLLDKLSSTLSEQKEAAKQIRLLTKRMPSFRSFFGETTDAIPKLLNPLSNSERLNEHPDLQEDLITSILNLSINDKNKQLIAEHPMVIPLLVESLKCGNIETRSNAAATLFTLSALDSNKQLIGRSGGLKPLIDLLEEGHPLAMKDVGAAIFNLCLAVENRTRAVNDGAVRVILQKLKDGVFVEELLAILAILASCEAAIEELGNLGALACLLHIIRENTCERNKENAIAIVYSLCLKDTRKLSDVLQENHDHRTITILAQDGTARARRKAQGLLDRLHRGWMLGHTA